MQIRRIVTPLILIGVAVGVGYMAANVEPPEQKGDEKSLAPLVETVSLSSEQLTVLIDSQGKVVPGNETTLISEVSGSITDISPLFVAGGVFQKGDVLFKVDPINYQVRVDQARAGQVAAQARLAEESARASAEKKNWLNSGKKIADAPALLIRTPQLREAKARVAAANTELANARIMLDKTSIRAPYSGMVRSRSVGLGQYINAGTQLGAIFGTDYAEIRLPVAASKLPWLQSPSFGQHANEPASVRLSARFGKETVYWTANLVRAEGEVDPGTRMHYVVARIEDPYALSSSNHQLPLKSGTFVKARITGRSVPDLMVVPREFLTRNDEVLVLDDENKLRTRKVDVAYQGSENAYIKNGLQEGERLILTALPSMVDGMALRVTTPAAAEEDQQDTTIAELSVDAQQSSEG